MPSIRTSLIFSVGSRAGAIAQQVQDYTEARLPELEPVVAFVNLAADGSISRRRGGEKTELARVEGLRQEEEPGVYRKNFELLCGAADLIERLVDDVLRDLRKRETLAEIRHKFGWGDSERIFVHLLADSFGPVASTFPLALLQVLESRRKLTWASLPVSFNLLYFLPGLFDREGSSDRRMARTHATFSEIESFLFPPPGEARRTPPSCKVWVVGSIDRGGGTVDDFSSLVTPTSYFISRSIDGSLEGDSSWETVLYHNENSRRTFLSSFGFADLYYPRAFLEQLVLEWGRSKLCRHLTEGRARPDRDAISAEVQTWVRGVKLEQLVSRLQDPREGKLVFKHRAQPEYSPLDVQPARYFQEVDARLVEDPEWRGSVQRAGNHLFEAQNRVFAQKIEDVVDGSEGLPAGSVFCANLAGVSRGLTDALVGFNILNLESLILDHQTYFARHAGLEGDPERVRELQKLISGKREVIESETKKLQTEKERLQELQARHEDEEPVQDAEAEGPAKTEDEASAEEAAPEPEAAPDAIFSSAEIADAQARAANIQEDLKKYGEELKAFEKERAQQEAKISETRRLASDPARRDRLMRMLADAEQPQREKERQAFGQSVTDRNSTRAYYIEESQLLWRIVRLHLVLAPLGVGVIVALVYAAVANQIQSLTFNWTDLRDLFLLSSGITLFIGFFFFLRQWMSRRNAKRAYDAAVRQVRVAADSLWTGRVEALRKHFQFLLHAEAIRILERLQNEVLDEGVRLGKLTDRLEKYGAAAKAAMAGASLESSLYHRPALQQEEAERYVKENKVLARTIDEVVESLTLSSLIRMARENKSAALPAVVSQTEQTLRLRCGEILDEKHIGAVLDQALAENKDESLRNRWRSVQEAAMSWISLREGAAPTQRTLFFLPSALSASLRDFLRSASLAPRSEDRESEDRDQIGVCETWIGFPSHRIAELSLSKKNLDDHWDSVTAVENTPQLSRSPKERVQEEEALALLQAALAYLGADDRAADPKSPQEWLRRYRAADELPNESPDQLREQISAAVKGNREAARRLEKFVQDLTGWDRRKAESVLPEF